jgi:predicted alpha/beta superfamily hydrolase
MNQKKAHALSLFVAVLFASYLQAQPSGIPITIGEQLNIDSGILGEQRSVIVGLPESYSASNTSYPVLYLLDGASHFNYISGVVYFLAANDFIPEMIVVAVNNTDRNRDLTPPSQAPLDLRNAPTLGGADNFQRYLAEELMPWIETNYRTQSYKVLMGHSFGGLFAIHTLTTRPELFNAYWTSQSLLDTNYR